MSLAERYRIEAGLASGKSVRQIAKDLGRSTSTVSREVDKHTSESFKGCYGRKNQCVHRADCKVSDACASCPARGGARCAVCSLVNCNRVCKSVEYIGCAKREARSAQVCNGCADEKRCHLRKLFYSADGAHDAYRRDLSEKRQGAALEPGEIEYLDALVSPKIRDGQSVHHICVTNAARLTRHERTVQRYVNYGVLSARRGDLKRACMVRPRKTLARAYQHKVETGCYVGRTYDDLQAYLAENPGVEPVLMDLVIGRPGGVCLMTLHWPRAAFMVGILIPNKCAESVVAAFERLYEELGPELFGRLFPVILTDRGTEFSAPSRIETAPDGSRRTRVYFCDPMNSNQKSKLERNHEIVREVLPKGMSFDGLSQPQADLLFSHVNADVRKSMNDRTPYDVFEFLYGAGTAARLRVSRVDPREIVLKPRLLGIEVK